MLSGLSALRLNTETKYPRPIPIPYPIVGEQNSATRLGMVSVAGGAVRWLDISEADKAKVFYGNAERVFNLPRSARRVTDC